MPYSPTRFSIDKLYPAGLPRIHPVPATHRMSMVEIVQQRLAEFEWLERLERLLRLEPDNDAEIDAALAHITELPLSIERAVLQYRHTRDVEGWA